MAAAGERVTVTFDGHIERHLENGWVGVQLDNGYIHWVHEDNVEPAA